MTEKQQEPSKTILLIDDEKDLCDVVSEFLKEANYKVVTAADGIEGIRKYKNQKFDLVITDLKMPKKSGVEVISEIRSGAKDMVGKHDSVVPIVVLSGNIDIHKPELAMIENLHLFYKPFNREELLMLVDGLLKESRMVYKRPSGGSNELLKLVSSKVNEMMGIVLKQKGEVSEQDPINGPLIIQGDQLIQHSYKIGDVEGRIIYSFNNGLGKQLAMALTKSIDENKLNSNMIFQALDMFGRAIHTKILQIIGKKHKSVIFGKSRVYSGEIFAGNTEKGYKTIIKTSLGDLHINDIYQAK